MSIRGVVLGAVALLLAACGGGGGVTFPPAPTPTPETTPAPTPTRGATTGEPLEDLRVAFVNLAMPPAPPDPDADDATPSPQMPMEATTFDARLTGLARELEEFAADIIIVNEASWMRDMGRATRLAEILKMEFSYTRANPWPEGRSREESDALVDAYGYEEGELVLVRPPLRLLEAETAALEPRHPETGERRVALRVLVGLPYSDETFTVYGTNFPWDDPGINEELAHGFVAFVEATRGEGPIVGASGVATPAPEVLAIFAEAGLVDVVADALGEEAPATCCRESLSAPEAPDESADDDGENGDAGEEPEEPGAPDEAPEMAERRDFVFTDGWRASSVTLLAVDPVTLANGRRVYISDHLGLGLVFALDSTRSAETGPAPWPVTGARSSPLTCSRPAP